MSDKPSPHFRRLTVILGILMLFSFTSCGLPTRFNQAGLEKTPSLQTPEAATQTSQFQKDGTQTITPPPDSLNLNPCAESKGRILNRIVPTDVIGESISIKVYLPPCYSGNISTRYPVLYMLHGQTSLDDQWMRLGLLTKMDELLAQDALQPFIIILPNEIKSNLDPTTSTYGENIVDKVIPFVDDSFRTCRERSCRAIGGLSRGGNWSVHLGFTNPELFTAVGAHSSPLFYGEITRIYHFFYNEDALNSLPVFYIDVGDNDEVYDDVMLFFNTLQRFNVQREFNIFIGKHDESYWSSHTQDYLLWYDSQFQKYVKDSSEPSAVK